MSRQITYAQAINEALHQAMKLDSSVICYGLGIPDPTGVFGTSLQLEEDFGSERVFDMPTAENGMTGVAIGAALGGLKPVMCHQRLDFCLLAMDQLVNNAAKWHYMFGGAASVNITVRLILGRGWGQGPTHSQNLQAWFGHIPGLKVVMPLEPADAKGMLMEAIFDPNPVIYLEHRWLHNQLGDVPEGDFRVPLDKAKVIREGSDISLVASSYMNIEALHAANALKEIGISCEIVDIASVQPIDWATILKSIQKTGRLLALDTGHQTLGLASEIVAKASMELFAQLKQAPRRLALPDVPTPTSYSLTKTYYPCATEIVLQVGEILGKDVSSAIEKLSVKGHHDQPGVWFKGPF